MRRKRIICVVAVLSVALASLSLWAVVVEPSSLVTREITLKLSNWSPALNRLKVVAVSDIHGGSNFIDEAKIRQIVVSVNRTQPDLIVLLGDFVTGNRSRNREPKMTPETVAKNLKGLQARYGVFAVLGNHDWWYDGLRVRRALEASGVRVLENDAVRLQVSEQSLWLVGLADLWTRPQDIDATIGKVSDDKPVIVITHNPDVFPQIPARVSLSLAGHTHGGQVSLPLFGRLVVPSQYGQRYAVGHITEKNRDLYVTPGIGTSVLPVRFCVPPEISVLTLLSQ